jgi:hypothetical protein
MQLEVAVVEWLNLLIAEGGLGVEDLSCGDTSGVIFKRTQSL